MAFAHGVVQVAAAAFPQGQLHHGWQGDKCGTRKSKKSRCAVMQHLHLHTSTRLSQDCYKIVKRCYATCDAKTCRIRLLDPGMWLHLRGLLFMVEEGQKRD